MTLKDRMQKAKDSKDKRVWSDKDVKILKELIEYGCTPTDIFHAKVFPNISKNTIFAWY